MKRFVKNLGCIFTVFMVISFIACKVDLNTDTPEPDTSETYTVESYTVEFDTKGEGDIPSQTVKNGQKTVKPDDPSKDAEGFIHYRFGGWYTSTDQGVTLSSVPFDFNKPITSNIKLYAKWICYEPLAFEFIAAGSIVVTNPWTTLKYSINGGALTPYTDEISVDAGDKVYLFAQQSENTLSEYMKINCLSDCYIYGNIMSLVTLDEQNNWNPDESRVSEYAFQHLFTSNQHIINHEEKELYLPATTLADYCYYSMFYNCSSLTTAPSLPARTLANYCYYSMFYNCSSLTTPPSLPATTLAKYCYETMFSTCRNLTTAPSLPATTLADYCYFGMFYNCSSLTATPSLPATNLADYCYYYMFCGCTSLTTASSLPAKTLKDGCYRDMFSGCTNLTTVPSLPVTTLTDDCYHGMFYECRSLTTAPSLPAATLTEKCYYLMFWGCSKLNEIECLATDITATDCTHNWLGAVSSKGTFIKAKGMTDWVDGGYGIPSGWTVEEKEP